MLAASPSECGKLRPVSGIKLDASDCDGRISEALEAASAETAAMLFWALLAAGQITMRKVDGWQTLTNKPLTSRLTSGKPGGVGATARDNRCFVEVVLYRYRAETPWRDLPQCFGGWKTPTGGSAVGPSEACGRECSSIWPPTPKMNTR
jgi:hypothetical protein